MERSSGSERSLGGLWAEQIRVWNEYVDIVREGSKRALNLWTKQVMEVQKQKQRLLVGRLRSAGRVSSGFCSAWTAARTGETSSRGRHSGWSEERGRRESEARTGAPGAGGEPPETTGLLRYDSSRELEAPQSWEGPRPEELEECPPGYEEVSAEPGADTGAEPSRAKRKCRPRQPGKKARAKPTKKT